MFEQVFNLLPRLRQFPQNYDLRKILVEQPWVLVQEDPTRRELIFEKSGRILDCVNRKAKVGQWEYLSDARNLLLYIGGERNFLNFDFVSTGLLVLKRKDLPAQAFVLVNERKIPDLNIGEYLYQLAEAQRSLRWLTTESGLKLEYTAAQSDEANVGTPVSVNGEAVPDGLYKILGENVYVRIRNSKISHKIKQVQYLTDKGLVTADISDYGLSNGDSIHIEGVPVRDDRYLLKESTGPLYFNTLNGSVSKIWSRQDRTIMRIGVLILFAIVVVAWHFSNHNDTKALRQYITEQRHSVAAFSKRIGLP